MDLTELIFMAALVGATTLAAFAAAKVLSPAAAAGSLLQGLRALLDWAGMFAIFLAANLILGAAVILLIRALTPRFVALYALENVPILILSGAQAFVFQAWWRRESTL
jgi:hypothetical protein